jgi:hypothetical protein
MGGAIALGHPLGATGAIRAATVVHALRRHKLKYGMVTMCVGMGQGAAGILLPLPGSWGEGRRSVRTETIHPHPAALSLAGRGCKSGDTMSIKTATLNGVATIEIARPEKKNALTVAMYQAMADAIRAAATTRPCARC